MPDACHLARAEAAFATVSPKRSSPLKIFAAAFIDGYDRLTDTAARQNFPVQIGESVANVAVDTARVEGRDKCRGATGRLRFRQA